MNRLISIVLVACVCILLGCGDRTVSNKSVPNGTVSSGEQDKLINETLDLSIKILDEVQSGKDIPAVNAAYEKQIAELDARLAKLPPLTDEATIKRRQALGGKYREIDEKTAAIALQGPLPKLPNYTLYTEEQSASGK